MTKSTNLRNLTVGPDTAKDFRDTKVLDGLATRSTPDQNAKNETTEYGTGKPKIGAVGGKNSGS